MAVNLTVLAGGQYSGQSAFNQLTQNQLSQLVNQYHILASVAYTGLTSAVAVGDILMVVVDSGAAYVKVLVTAVSSTSATLQYQCYGSLPALPPPSAPGITQILNNYSYLPQFSANYGIAPSSLFIVQGTNLADPGSIAILQSSAPPGLPLTLNGTSISINVSGTTISVPIYYAAPSQIAAVLPAKTPLGLGSITVARSGQANISALIEITAAAPGLASYYGTGSGPAIATDPVTGSLFTAANSARPGQTIVLWGSGLGADSSVSDTTFTIPTKSLITPLQILIGGVQATISYHGSSGYPGVNQINVTIPAATLPGCSVSLIAMSGDIVSNTLTLPISASSGSCSDPAFGISGSSLAGLSAQSSVLVGQFSVSPIGASGLFQKMTGTDFALTGGIGSLGSCSVTTNPAPASPVQGIDVGNITATDSAGSFPFVRDSSGTYLSPAQFSVPVDTVFSLQGSGNTSMGSFAATLTLPGARVGGASVIAPFDISGDLSVKWAGTAPGTVMRISSGPVNSYPFFGEFTCYASADAGQFTVPRSVLLALPGHPGSLTLQNLAYVPFSASGLGMGLIVLSISQVTANVSYY